MKDCLLPAKRRKSPNKDSSLFIKMRINEQAISVVQMMLDNCFSPEESWPDHEKEEITFYRCALEEIRNLIWDNPFVSASNIVEDFGLHFQICSEEAKLPEQKRMFLIFSQTATELYEIVMEVEK